MTQRHTHPVWRPEATCSLGVALLQAYEAVVHRTACLQAAAGGHSAAAAHGCVHCSVMRCQLPSCCTHLRELVKQKLDGGIALQGVLDVVADAGLVPTVRCHALGVSLPCQLLPSCAPWQQLLACEAPLDFRLANKHCSCVQAQPVER